MTLGELQSTTGKAMEIMLVEDSLVDARITIESLRKCGIHHRVTLFRDGGEAVDFSPAKRHLFACAAAGCDPVGFDTASHRRHGVIEDPASD